MNSLPTILMVCIKYAVVMHILNGKVAKSSVIKTMTAETTTTEIPELFSTIDMSESSDIDSDNISTLSSANFSNTDMLFIDIEYKNNNNNNTNSTFPTILMEICLSLLEDPQTCTQLYEMFKNENYLRLMWELTNRAFFHWPFAIFIIAWFVGLIVLNFVTLFILALTRPLRAMFLTKLVSDLRRRYYFTNDSTELRVVDNNFKK